MEVTLDSDSIGLHSETFLIEPPSHELAFPLADDVPSESTLELLPVGTYKRVMMVVAEDGDRWNVNENVGSALDTVTVVERAVTDRQQVIRDGNMHVRFDNLALTENDRLVYISSTRHDWQAIRSLLSSCATRHLVSR